AGGARSKSTSAGAPTSRRPSSSSASPPTPPAPAATPSNSPARRRCALLVVGTSWHLVPPCSQDKLAACPYEPDTTGGFGDKAAWELRGGHQGEPWSTPTTSAWFASVNPPWPPRSRSSWAWAGGWSGW